MSEFNAEKFFKSLQDGFFESWTETTTKPSDSGIPDNINDFLDGNKNPFATVKELDMALRSIIAAKEGKAAGRVLDFIIEHRDHFLNGQKEEETTTESTQTLKAGYYSEEEFTFTGDEGGWTATWKGQEDRGPKYVISRDAATKAQARARLIEAIEAEGFVKR